MVSCYVGHISQPVSCHATVSYMERSKSSLNIQAYIIDQLSKLIWFLG